MSNKDFINNTSLDVFDFNPNGINSLDELFTYGTPIGSRLKASSNLLYGLDVTGQVPAATRNRDFKGMTFFTRPILCLNDMNLSNNRDMYDLMTTNSLSVNRYVRCLLDPRLHHRPNEGGMGIDCPLVDENCAFMPVLSNTLLSISGFPDIVLPTFTSDEGIRREQWAMADGYIDILDSADLDLKFINTGDEPIMLLIQTWIKAASRLYEGLMAPYMDIIAENEICYQTRIYRFIMDPTITYIKKCAIANACFPINYPMGSEFDYNEGDIYIDSNNEINVRMKCSGFSYNDPIIVREFNTVVSAFNKIMGREKTGYKPDNKLAVKVPKKFHNLFNFRLYPHINEDTLELEWYTLKSSKRYQKLKSLGLKI